ncbi:MAG: hypothetical protein ACOZQL_36640 [Myxococcota bacterium]
MALVDLRVVLGNLLELEADVLAVKHAQNFHGSDSQVMSRLSAAGVSRDAVAAVPGEARLFPSNGAVKAKDVLFVGTVPISEHGYHDVRRFAGDVLAALQPNPTPVRTLVLTVHGTNCGLDEGEAALALAGGLIDGIQRGRAPATLERITIVERKEGRALRFQHALRQKLKGLEGVTEHQGSFLIARPLAMKTAPSLPDYGLVGTPQKPHAFVAMPFAPEFEDVFHYGIQAPLNGAGLLCERVDESVFEGLIIQRILARIASAKVVIAELSGANPNVYLEVGYAWASKVPTILLVRDVNELRFDVKAHRCVVYRSIRELEALLTAELRAL